MTDRKTAGPGGEDRLRAELHRALGQVGWRVPQSAGEVKSAEQWPEQQTQRLPSRLSQVPELAAPVKTVTGERSFLARYFPEEGPNGSEPERQPELDRDGPDLDR